MKGKKYIITEKVWLYPGMSGWHFVTLPKEESKEISEIYSEMKRGWGSLPVEITIGSSTWKTSIFPDKTSGCYLFPLKAPVRKKEKIEAGAKVKAEIEIRV